MSVICLVRPLLSATEFNGYPLNLLILAAALKRFDHTIEICDYDFLKETDATWTDDSFAHRAAIDIMSKNPDYVGITALCSNFVLALDVAEELKALSPNTHITLGGPHVSLCARETLQRHPYIDTAVLGEGEVTYPELIETLIHRGDLSKVHGIAFQNCHHEICVTPPRELLANLNDSPRPAFDLVDVKAYKDAVGENYMELYVGSGCPFACIFCSTSIVWKRKYRTMIAQRVVDEMEMLNSTYGISLFNFIHDNLTTNKKLLTEITGLIKDRNLRVRWGFSSRIDTINLDTIRNVASAGCDYIFFGVESGSEKIQNNIGKKLKLQKINEVIENCIHHGIAPTTSFIIGFGEETQEDISATIKLAFKCRAFGAKRSFINLLSAYTGTPIMLEEFDNLKFSRNAVNSTMVSFLYERHYKMIEEDPFIFSSYYSINRKDPPLSSAGYVDLVDFYTICLARYRFTGFHLFNDLDIDPFDFFQSLKGRMRSLSVDARNRLAINLTFDDLKPFISSKQAKIAMSFFQFDHAIWLATTTQKDGVIYRGQVRLGEGGHPKVLSQARRIRHYMLRNIGGEVHVSELEPNLSELYELQGVYALNN